MFGLKIITRMFLLIVLSHREQIPPEKLVHIQFPPLMACRTFGKETWVFIDICDITSAFRSFYTKL